MTEEEKSAPKKRLLGEILMDRGMITPQQLREALDVQRREKSYLGEILVRLGHVQERDIVAALVVQCNLPYIAIDKYEIDRDIIDLVPGEIVRQHRVVPLDRVGGILSLVMQDPFNTSVKVDLRHRTRCTIAPFIATRTEIERAIDRWYR